MTAPYRFITISASHYCDKARWAMDRAGIVYVEEGHLPIAHLRATLPLRLRSGRKDVRATPCLVRGKDVWPDSTGILLHVDAGLPEPLRLFPAEPTLRAAVEAWEARCDDDLGPNARRLAYWHVLPHKDLALRALQAGVPGWEVALVRAAYPLAARGIRRTLHITDESAARSLAKVRALFADASAALAAQPADAAGQRWLVGDRMSAADVTFAALAAPVLLPDDHPFMNVPVEDTPPAFAAIVRELRATAAGAHGTRMYADERGRKVV
ncbi:MAG: glutathione S-transferase [Myxococcales bacterium]|nr:glutathione S-transferase [Myxococcales bacterium]